MRRYQKGLILFFCLILLIACDSNKNEKIATITTLITETKQEFAPDKRVALFDLEPVIKNSQIILKGESNLPEAVKGLQEKLNIQNISFIDSVQLLPTTQLNGLTQGIISISVANLRGKPAHSSELVTQATLGTPVSILKSDNNWYLIQTPDRYLSWVDDGGIVPLMKEDFLKWKSSDKIIFTQTMGEAYSEADQGSQVVSDMVAGAVLSRLGEEKEYFKVQFPDGRTAYIQKSQAQEYDVWLASLNPSQESLVNTSKALMGLPYLWGGTSTKGVDCSGFTKTIYFLNGIILPRDASQQIHTGNVVDNEGNFDRLLPGDLLFFGKPATSNTKERVVHVGMWLGNNEFIHSSGRVHISSMDKNAPHFDAYNLGRYLRSNRYLKQPMEGLIELVKKPVFKD